VLRVSDPSNPSETSASLGNYYDALSRWTSLARPFGYGGGVEDFTVHRRLADPRLGGRPTTTRVHDVIAESLPLLSHPRILDAGCGLGGTMLDFVRRYDGTAVGLTLSDTQRRRALDAARALKVGARIDVRIQTYDAPPAGPFDLVVAIESLAHSAAPGTSVAALAAALRPGGVLAIVDDMPLPAALDTEDFDAFKRGWLAPVVWPHARFLEAFEEAGLRLLVDRDMTHALRVRTLEQIRRLTLANRWLHRVVPSQRWCSVLDSHHGGLALERLYRREEMQYRLLVARRA
jgi:SAM-dependent methyltransferase